MGDLISKEAVKVFVGRWVKGRWWAREGEARSLF